MTEKNLQLIQERLGYDFSEPNFLRQAFTRKSYSEENGTYDNEVLEFYGDKALEFIIMKKLSEYYGKISKLGYCSQKAEGQLTDIKKKLVCKEMLASCIDKLGFAEYLLMGKGDIKQNQQSQDSVKEDLFEAIIGAVTIDSGWNTEDIEKVVDKMIDVEYYLENGFEDDNNYVALIQTWCQKKYGELPQYDFYETFDGYQCLLCFSGEYGGTGFGCSKQKARMNAAKTAYEQLEKKGLFILSIDEVGTPDFDRAINQLQELYQKGCIGEPWYDFIETTDEYGNLAWRCECHVENQERCFWKVSPSKKQSKKAVAYDMLCYVLDREA